MHRAASLSRGTWYISHSSMSTYRCRLICMQDLKRCQAYLFLYISSCTLLQLLPLSHQLQQICQVGHLLEKTELKHVAARWVLFLVPVTVPNRCLPRCATRRFLTSCNTPVDTNSRAAKEPWWYVCGHICHGMPRYTGSSTSQHIKAGLLNPSMI